MHSLSVSFDEQSSLLQNLHIVLDDYTKECTEKPQSKLLTILNSFGILTSRIEASVKRAVALSVKSVLLVCESTHKRNDWSIIDPPFEDSINSQTSCSNQLVKMSTDPLDHFYLFLLRWFSIPSKDINA